MVKAFLKDTRAVEFSEVALMLAVVVLAAIGAYQLLGGKIQELVNNVANYL